MWLQLILRLKKMVHYQQPLGVWQISNVDSSTARPSFSPCLLTQNLECVQSSL